MKIDKFSALLDTPEFSYQELFWGEHIRGTKEQIQAFGIGAGLPFPGEPGGNRFRMTTVDPRGFKTKISEWGPWRGEESDPGAPIYSALVFFPGRSRQDRNCELAPGVKKRECIPGDYYLGSDSALIAAGIVRPETLPGAPGMRRVTVTILRDGTVLGGCPTSNKHGAGWNDGDITISRKGKGRCQVFLRVSSEEQSRRAVAEKIAEREFLERIAQMPRPRSLIAIMRAKNAEAYEANRASMRLVWSRPNPIFNFNFAPL